MIIIRIAEKEKIQEVLDLFADTLESLSKGKEFRNKMAEKFASNAAVITLEENGCIRAFAAFYANDMYSHTAFLSMIAVLQDYRGRGIARGLLDVICTDAEERGMAYLRLEVKKDNISAKRFYRNNHFSVVEERIDSYIMERRLKEDKNG